MHRLLYTMILFGILGMGLASQDYAENVQIRRTAYGVPHIIGENLESVAFGLAYAQLEDRGEKVILPLIRSKGVLAKYTGEENIESDLYAKLVQEYTRNTFHLLDRDTRDILSGFAKGVNFYLEKHPEQFPSWYYQQYSAVDIAAASNRSSRPSQYYAWDFLEKLEERKKREQANDDAGSNVWAFAPERTKSGHAILMRNPHLSWEAGYYEAHITVPGKINFYGDFRIGGMFAIICGFNDHLGWSTTNNYPDLEEVYAMKADPALPDHYLLDGISHPIQRKQVVIEFKNGEGSGLVHKEWLYTPFGPVIDRSGGLIHIVKTADWNNFRRGEQLVAMMKSKTLDEWTNAMKKRNISASNYTYADDQGNIFYIWNASIPKLPHEFHGDTTAHLVQKSSEIWNEYQDFNRIPQLLNPTGGYVQNCNDPFYFTNLKEPMSREDQPDNYPKPLLRMRTQHSLSLIDNELKFSLEDVVKMKHSMKVVAAERFKEELIQLVQDSKEKSQYKSAAQYLSDWDNTSAPNSEGSVLFNEWFWNYRSMVGHDSLFSDVWNWDHPMDTPTGINFRDSARKAFVMAVDTLMTRYGDFRMKWGVVYRVRRGEVDVPVGGGSGTLGNFRVIYFGPEEEDGKRKVIGGDGWVFAVEFGQKIKAYSVLAYGQSNNPESPHFDDQASLFAANKMKRVAYSEDEIASALIRSYHPGQE